MRSTLCLCALAAATATSASPLAVIHARIEIGDGTVIPSGTVVMDGGKFVSVGADVTPPQGAEVIDAKGGTVLPGFIDATYTSGLKIPDAPAAGTPPDSKNSAPATMWHAYRRGFRPEISAAKCLDLGTSFASHYEKGVTTLVVVPSDGSVSGTVAVVDLGDKPIVLSSDVALSMALRNSGGGGYPSTLIAGIATIRQVFADAQTYSKSPADPVLEALQPALNGTQPVLFRAATARDFARVARFADEFKLKPMLHSTTEGWRVASELKARQWPVILSLHLPDEPSRKPETGTNPTPQEVLDDRHNTYLEKTQNAKKLAEAGIDLAFGDRPSSGDYLPPIRQLIKWGLPRTDAVKGIAFNPSRFFGVSDRLGSITPGKIANLVILSGDLTDEKSVIKTVISEGKSVYTLKEAGK